MKATIKTIQQSGCRRLLFSGGACLTAVSLAANFLWSGLAEAKPLLSKDLLIKFKSPEAVTAFATLAQDGGATIETFGNGQWLRVVLTDQQLQGLTLEQIRANPNVAHAQPNYPIRFPEEYRIENVEIRKKLLEIVKEKPELLASRKDNPPIPLAGKGGSGTDPLFKRQWGMIDIGADSYWKAAPKGNPVVVAVIDTGVDYTHEDLAENLWRNPGETGLDSQGRDKGSNGLDDDTNGYVDDTIGWDFAAGDNKPYDLATNPFLMMLTGGNPGHGTHCAGNVAAKAGNGKGISGVAPNAKIMALRFLNERGGGTTADAVKAIEYAVTNGARILSNSWGSIGEGGSGERNQALRDAIQQAQDKGVLFIAAAGNGFRGRGYDNDTAGHRAAFPASYPHDNIISVAAIDAKDQLGTFSNYGAKSVDLAAPGVKVFSTMVKNKYSDMVFKFLFLKVGWDGTSMAAPHVAGAAAAYWSMNPHADWREVKRAILESAKPVPALNGKLVTNGKLSVEALTRR